jgi:hypothetical protein
MKKRIIRIAVLTVAVVFTLALASCGGGLSGTYVYGSYDADDIIPTFNNEPIYGIEFKSFGNAEISAGNSTYVDGSFKKSGDELTLKAVWNIADKWEGTYSFSQSGDTIYIDGWEYAKQ